MPLVISGEGYRDFSEPRFFEVATLADIAKIRNPVDKAHAILIPTTGGAISVWKFYAGDTTSADGFTILAPLNTQVTGRWRLGEDQVDVTAVGADPTGTLDSSAAIQTAIDTGRNVFFPQGDYLANNLTQNTVEQVLFGDGNVRIIKNANGALFTSTARDVQLINLLFAGEASTPVFTGHNVVSSGADFAMLNCGSRWAYGRAVLATGDRVQILGTNQIYQTADATATGYDIEIGVEGTATLYHTLHGIYTSQATGGIKFNDTGSHELTSSQIGKLTINKGTGPGGTNGGMTTNCRILGDVVVELSSAVFTANQFGVVSVTFASGTSGCTLDATNVFETGATVVNNGNANNLILRNVATGSGVDLQFGADSGTASGLATLRVTPSAPEFQFLCRAAIANNKSVVGVSSTGTDGFQIFQSNVDNFTLKNNVTGLNTVIAQSGTGTIQLYVNDVLKAKLDNTATAGQTAMLVYDVDTATLQRVLVGAAGTGPGGSGRALYLA